MINLLPEKEKALLHKEYRLRVVVMYLGVIAALCITAVVLLIPSYILSLYRRKAVETAPVQLTPESQKEKAALLSQIEKGKDAIKILKPEASSKLPTELISLIIKNKSSDITINSIGYTYTKPQTFLIKISGVAKTRQSLIAFKTSLEKEEGIAQIVLPVSNLAKDANISFSFEITNKK
jgi:hypothetical protein